MKDIAEIAEPLGCALLLFDEELKVCHANPRAGEILEVASGELRGRPLAAIDALFLDRAGQPIAEENRPLHQVISRKERLVDAELTTVRENAHPLRITLNASPLFFLDGRIKGLVVDFCKCCPGEERLHRFIGAMDEVVFEFDAEGRYLNVWSESEELLKVPGRELFGRRFREFIPEDLADTLDAVFRQVRVTGEATTFEYPLKVLGGMRWFLARVSLVPAAHGREPTFSFVARDISEQKQLEKRVRESERRFRGIFENAATGIALVASDGRCLETNQCLRDMLGYSAKELRQLPFTTYSHPEEIGADLEQFERMMRGEIASYSMEKRFVRKDRSTIWGHLTVALQRDEQGRPLYSIGVVENITERKRVEFEREKLLGELEAIFASAGDGIIFYDKEGNILKMNEAAKEILGYTDDMISASIAQRYRLWAPRRLDGTMPPLEESALYRVFQGEATGNTTTQVRRLDGDPVWISFSASPVFDATGAQIGAVSTLTDITRQRELQERLEDYLHMLAHDLRSPLTVISGYAEILEEKLRDSEQGVMEGTQAILGAADQMHSMMEDLVEAGRLESGQATLHDDLIDLGAFMSEFLKRQISSDYQRVSVEIPADLPLVRIGKNHLARVLQNLIANALKYSEATQAVEIGAARDEAGRICLTVRDHGKGIAPEDQPHIFGRFYRSACAKDRAGTGMGLYITKKLIEAYGGSIQVESKEGEGSIFTFCIPAA